MRRTPLLPANSAVRNVSGSLPNGEMRPQPVMTVRRVPVDMRASSGRRTDHDRRARRRLSTQLLLGHANFLQDWLEYLIDENLFAEEVEVMNLLHASPRVGEHVYRRHLERVDHDAHLLERRLAIVLQVQLDQLAEEVI